MKRMEFSAGRAGWILIPLLAFLMFFALSGTVLALTGDLDGDGDVDRDDLTILLADRNQPVDQSACGPACDLDGDGTITVLDARKLVLQCTLPRCAVVPHENQPPVTDAGQDITLALPADQTTVEVTLDGSGSHDPDGTITTYTWTGSPDPDDIVQPKVDLGAGTYTFSLVVEDEDGAVSSPDSVTVTILAFEGPDRRMSFTPESLACYSGGQKVDLEVYAGQFSIRVAQGQEDNLRQWLEREDKVKHPLEIEELGRKNILLVSLIEGITVEEIFELVHRLNRTGWVIHATPVFGDEKEKEVLTDELVVLFKDSYSDEEIDNYIASKNVRILKKNFLWPKGYLLGFTSASGANTLDISRDFYESGMVEFAHPDFIILNTPPWAPNPYWKAIWEEDFESVSTDRKWTAYDSNPADGEYYWGRVSKEDYPSWIDDYTEGDYKLWVSGSHAPGDPDLYPDNTYENYAPNMDAWLVFGPFDLRDVYWSFFEALNETHVPVEKETMREMISFDGENWTTVREGFHGGTVSGHYMGYANLPGVGNVNGVENVWFAIEFISDGEEEQRDFVYRGISIDDVRLMASNTEPAPSITADPFSPRQWALHNVGQSGGAPGWDINVLPAWEVMEGNPYIPAIEEAGPIVAVLDEGVDLSHEDLNLVEGYDATYDPSDPDSTDSHGAPFPWDGHGTACAGIIGAIRNDKGIVGVAPGIRIMPVRIAFKSDPESTHWSTTTSTIADGILWAVNHSAKVLSNSWGTYKDWDIIRRAVQDAHAAGVVLVFAAGNDNYSEIHYPARYAETVAVGAMSPCGERKGRTYITSRESCDEEFWWGSNYGPELDLVAPGVMIPTTDVSGEGGYVKQNSFAGVPNYFMNFGGTSAATPHVAGVAALAWTVAPNLSGDDIRMILFDTARDIDPAGQDDETGHGLVDAYAAVERALLQISPPDLVLKGLSFEGELAPAGQIRASLTIENQGLDPSGSFDICMFLSEDSELGLFDVPLGSVSAASISGREQAGIYATLPIASNIVPGDYYLIGQADCHEAVEESKEDNNLLAVPIRILVPSLVVKPESLDFGEVLTGTVTSKDIQIKNEREGETGPLLITGITSSGNGAFQLDMTNPPTPSNPWVLQNYEDVLVPVYFSPQAPGAFSATVRITSNDPETPERVISVSGSAVEAFPDIDIPGMITFDDSETDFSLNIENRGNSDLLWTVGPDDYQGILWPSWLTVSPQSGRTGPGITSSVSVTVNREGLDIGTYVYNIYIHSNDPNDPDLPVLIVLNVATPPAKPEIVVIDGNLVFSDVPTGSSQSQEIIVKNGGSADLHISDVSVSGASEFALSANDCIGTLPPYSDMSPVTCSITVTFTPAATDPVYGTISIESDDPDTPVFTGNLSGNGIQPYLSVAPPSVDFGETQTEALLAIQNTDSSRTLNWTIADDLPSWLTASLMNGEASPGAFVRVKLSVNREGLAPGTYTHILSITSNGGDEAVEISMTVPAPLTISPAQVEMDPCGDEQVFAASGGAPPYTFELTSSNGDGVPDVAGLEAVDPGSVRVSVGSCDLGMDTNVDPVDNLSLNPLDPDVTVISYPSESLDVTEPSYTKLDLVPEVHSQCGVSDLTLKVTDQENSVAEAQIGFSPGGAPWTRTYAFAADHDDDAGSVKQTSDGGYIMTGSSYLDGDHDWHFWILKLDAEGEVQWRKIFTGVVSIAGEASTVMETFDDQGASTGYVFAATAFQPSVGMWVIRMDSSGAVQWQRLYATTAGDLFVNSIRQTPGGDYVMVGEIAENGVFIERMFLMKIQADGNILWAKSYRLDLAGVDNDDIGEDIDLTAEGGVVMVGYSMVPGTVYDEYAVVLKLDESGKISWKKVFQDGTAGNLMRGYSVRQTFDAGGTPDGYILAGVRELASGGEEEPPPSEGGGMVPIGGGDGEPTGSSSSTHLLVLRLDPDGDPVWHKDFANFDGGTDPAVRQDPDGGFIVAAATDTSDIWLIKLDDTGAVAWQHAFGGTGSEWLSTRPDSLDLTGDGGYVVAGITRSFGPGLSDAWILKLNPDGSTGCSP